MADFGAGLSGAASGAAMGSSFGPIGTGVGAVAGGLMGLFGSKKKKKPPTRLSSFDSKQKALYQDYISSLRGQGPFNDMYKFDDQGYNKVFDQTVARPAYRGFEENIIPGITGQFRSNNLQNSSYMGEALGRAGRNVQENLDAQRASGIFQGQQGAIQNKQNSINNILGMQTFAYQRPEAPTPNVLDQILGKVAPAAGDWFADYLSRGRA